MHFELNQANPKVLSSSTQVDKVCRYRSYLGIIYYALVHTHMYGCLLANKVQ